MLAQGTAANRVGWVGAYIDKADNVLSDHSQQDGKCEGAAQPEEVHQQLGVMVDFAQDADTCTAEVPPLLLPWVPALTTLEDSLKRKALNSAFAHPVRCV